MDMIRLDKFLSSQLGCSRTDAKKLLREKRITVNGVVAVKGDLLLEPDTSAVCKDGQRIQYEKFVYIIQNKPAGVVSASSAPGDVTVIDILPASMKRKDLFPAGRLDRDTTGLMLITDDGAFAHEILSPAHHVEKTYLVTLERKVTLSEASRIEAGLVTDEENYKPAVLRPVDTAAEQPRYEIVLTEGRYHQIKRMFAFFGNRVCALHRTKIGGLALPESLAPGESRKLTPGEVQQIKLL
ncbi:MAG: rRNA pseudouridine synthase [Clostridia bacterium]|nr:rRNA pseudouridine synthase [Clostridia bacterium]